jgi:hypothetical protein
MKKVLFYSPAFSLVAILLATPTANAAYFLTNPLGSSCQNVMCILGIFMNFLYVIGPAIAVIMILWGAFQIFTAGGDVEKVKAGRSTILYAVIGLVIILAGSGIDLIIQNLLTTGT